MSTVLDVLKIKNESGNWISIPGLRGEKGVGISSISFEADGTMKIIDTEGVERTFTEIKNAINETVIISPTQPASPLNKIWIDSDDNQAVVVPTMDDLKEATTSLLPLITIEDQLIASFTDGADNVATKRVNIRIDPVQSGSGDPAPDNIRPINGWTSAKITQTGKNLLDAQAIVESSGHSGHTYVENGYLKFKSGNPTVSGIDWADLKFPGPICGRISVKNFNESGTNDIKLRAYFDDGTYINIYNRVLAAGEEVEATFTAGTAGKTIVRIANVWTEERIAGINLSKSVIELGSAETGYEPYRGETHIITFPDAAGTVYGGTLDVTNGILTVDRAAIDMGSLNNWGYNGSVGGIHRLSARVARMKNGFAADVVSSIFTSSVSPVAQSGIDNSICRYENSLFVYYSQYTSVSDFISTVSGQYVVYPLETPLTYTLTSLEIKTLLGQNSIWTNTGNISIAYRADLGIFVKNLVNNGG